MLTNFMQYCMNPFNPTRQKDAGVKYKAQCYQVFGFDILIDSNKKAWLLEINDHPSMDVMMCKAAMGCNHKKNGCQVSKVDLFVKTQV